MLCIFFILLSGAVCQGISTDSLLPQNGQDSVTWEQGSLPGSGGRRLQQFSVQPDQNNAVAGLNNLVLEVITNDSWIWVGSPAQVLGMTAGAACCAGSIQNSVFEIQCPCQVTRYVR